MRLSKKRFGQPQALFLPGVLDCLKRFRQSKAPFFFAHEITLNRDNGIFELMDEVCAVTKSVLAELDKLVKNT
ncbi:MAG: hypothetical protein LBU36_06420, partial [Clostridiales bacterium]|nr:hypothetical protein [Clostridiales bacterium]